MAFDLENCCGATADGLECGTAPRICPRLGPAAVPLDAVTARSSAARASSVNERPANPVMPGTECPKPRTPVLAQIGSTGLQRSRVTAELVEGRLERPDRAAERAGVSSQPRQLLREIRGLARDVPGIELARGRRREIGVERLQLAGDAGG